MDVCSLILAIITAAQPSTTATIPHPITWAGVMDRTRVANDATQGDVEQERTEHINDPDDRVEFSVAKEHLHLFEGAKIRVSQRVPGLTALMTDQRLSLKAGGAELIRGAFRKALIQRDGDGGESVAVIPQRLGKIIIDLWGEYPNGGVVSQHLIAFVDPPTQLPKSLTSVNPAYPGGLDHSTIHVYLTPQQGGDTGLYAVYPDGTVPIPREFVQLRVETANGNEVIKLDPEYGTVIPVALGHALITTTYQGLSYVSCVIVEGEQAGYYRDHSRCEELLRSGQKLGLQP